MIEEHYHEDGRGQVAKHADADFKLVVKLKERCSVHVQAMCGFTS